MAFNGKKSNRSDTIVTLIAIFSIILAGSISIATITTEQNIDNTASLNIYDADPLARAEQAAIAGIHAAKGHIQCHGLVDQGGLPDQYFANGARFMTVWDDINVNDSTVHIISTGYCRDNNGEEHITKLESVVKIDLLISHHQPILHDYYDSHNSVISESSDN